jgi:hypothetical protein
MRRHLHIVLVAALGVAAFSLSAIVGWYSHQVERPRTAAAWKNKFDSLPAQVRGVDVIALAEAVSTMPSRVAHSEDGSDTLPFEVTDFRVVRALKGTSDGASLLVERAGGSDGAETVFIDADGGDFEGGRRYLLFLNRQEDGPCFYQINDEERFEIAAGRLRAVAADGPIAAVLHGRGVDEALSTGANGRQ